MAAVFSLKAASGEGHKDATPRGPGGARRVREFEVMGVRFCVDHKYAPLKALGKGAYGVVCACVNQETGAKVAIKKTTPMAATRIDSVHALREIRLLRWLGKHPNIVSLKDLMVDVPADELYVVMELMDTDLHRIIQSPQPLGEAHYKHFLYQLLLGLRFAHAHGVIHRDIKPANLLVTKSCDLVISDFGLARQMPSEAGPMTEHVVTRWYRAPELMLSADGHYTKSVDIWSAGCVLAELLGRTPLFAGKDFMETVAMQINVLGTRPREELLYIRSEQALQFLAAMPYKQPVPWSTLFPDASDKVLDLLNRMLQFHPARRISVEGALAHPYFDSVRGQYLEPDPVIPIGPGAFDFSFESDPTLTVNDFKRLIVEEAASLRAEKALIRRMRAEKLLLSRSSSAFSSGSGESYGSALTAGSAAAADTYTTHAPQHGMPAAAAVAAGARGAGNDASGSGAASWAAEHGAAAGGTAAHNQLETVRTHAPPGYDSSMGAGVAAPITTRALAPGYDAGGGAVGAHPVAADFPVHTRQQAQSQPQLQSQPHAHSMSAGTPVAAVTERAAPGTPQPEAERLSSEGSEYTTADMQDDADMSDTGLPLPLLPADGTRSDVHARSGATRLMKSPELQKARFAGGTVAPERGSAEERSGSMEVDAPAPYTPSHEGEGSVPMHFVMQRVPAR